MAVTVPAPTGQVGYDAVVLAGGAARRLGGVDKPALPVAGIRLLDRVLDAVADAGQVVVVGPQRPVGRPVQWTREQPAGGGPAAALAAGLTLVTAAYVAVLAADLALLDRTTVHTLLGAVTADGAVLVDDAGAEQLLAGAWRTGSLHAAVARAQPVDGVSVRRLLGGLVRAPVVPDRPVWLDCDTPADLRRAQELM